MFKKEYDSLSISYIEGHVSDIDVDEQDKIRLPAWFILGAKYGFFNRNLIRPNSLILWSDVDGQDDPLAFSVLTETSRVDELERYCETYGYDFTGSHVIVNSLVYGDENGKVLIQKRASDDGSFDLVYTVTPIE